MRAMGLRPKKDGFWLVVLTGTVASPSVVFHGDFTAPVNASESERLTWIRAELLALLDKFSPEAVLYKSNESQFTKGLVDRARVEGVLIEAAASHSLRIEATSKTLQQIKAALQYPGRASTGMLNSILADYTDLSDVNRQNYREAAASALVGLPH